MKLENQVVSLELAKQLKKAGFLQDVLYVWFITKGLTFVRYRSKNPAFQPSNKSFLIAAPTVAEFLEILPKKIKGKHLSVFKGTTKWVVNYGIVTTQVPKQEDKIVENALAKMCLYLKKKGLIK